MITSTIFDQNIDEILVITLMIIKNVKKIYTKNTQTQNVDNERKTK